MLQPPGHGQFTPAQVFLFGGRASVAFVFFSDLQQSISRIITAILNHILDVFTQFFRQIVINRQLTGINDAHIHAGLDRVIKECCMNRFPYRVIATE